MYIVSFIIGLIIVISSIFLIRFEFNKAVRKQALLLDQSKLYKNSDLFDMLDNLQVSIDEMNRAFYDIASDLEGKYSVHEKEIELINQRMDALKLQITSLNLGNNTVSNKSSEIKMNIEQMNKKVEEKTAFSPEVRIMDYSEKVIGDDKIRHKTQNEDRKEQELIDQIIEMRSKGKSLTHIARELGIGMGEIQLLLSLKK
ncbi:DUF6115 domain-containing protein [Fusibacter bizertensis]